MYSKANCADFLCAKGLVIKILKIVANHVTLGIFQACHLLTPRF